MEFLITIILCGLVILLSYNIYKKKIKESTDKLEMKSIKLKEKR
jgi:DNA-directed RNA polymerase subunit N (RpoN/RPB10)